jgi:putative transcriptional regulator
MAMIRQPENFPATVNRWENGKTIPSKLAQATFENFCTRMAKQGKLKHDQD